MLLPPNCFGFIFCSLTFFSSQTGVISDGEDDYVIEPVDVDQPSSITNASMAGTHVIYRTTDHEGHQDAIDCK